MITGESRGTRVMCVFHIKGLSGLLVFIAALVAIAATLVVVPSAFMMLLWNALVYDGLRLGSTVGLYQGFLLWALALIVFKIVFQPTIQFQLKSGSPYPADTSALEQPHKSE